MAAHLQKSRGPGGDAMAEFSAQVPEELIQRLHQATERFHAAREELERWMGASEYRHQERIGAAAEQLREAEREVESIEERISQLLHGQPSN
jgi:hypothetical protein